MVQVLQVITDVYSLIYDTPGKLLRVQDDL